MTIDSADALPRPANDGEPVAVGAVSALHRFVDAPGAIIPIRWHYVEAGPSDAEPLLFLHGNPESWAAWRPQIEHFAPRFHVLAPDLKGYGQSDKRPGDWRWENCAEEMIALLDVLGIKSVSIVAHDRGAVLADYLAGNHPERVKRYVRMQQVCHIWRAENSPQGVYFADPIFGPNIFADPDFYVRFRLQTMLKNPVSPERLEELKREMRYPGLAHAVVRYFQSSSFEKERLDRTSRLLRRMTFPVLLLQGDRDDGQPPYYFSDVDNPAAAQFPNATLRWIEGAGHYTHLEKPESVTAAISEFIAETK